MKLLKNKSVSNNSSNSSLNQNERKTPRIIGLGLLKLDFYINLTEELIRTYEIEFNKINSPKDLKFFCEYPILLNHIQISTTDNLTNILLYLNKANNNKSFVELITLNSLRFKPEEEFMRKIFAHVTETNYLFTNEMSLTNVPNKISFAIKRGKKMLKYFDIVCDYDPFSEDFKKEVNKNFHKNLNTNDEINENDERFSQYNKEEYSDNMKNEVIFYLIFYIRLFIFKFFILKYLYFKRDTYDEDKELNDNIIVNENNKDKEKDKDLLKDDDNDSYLSKEGIFIINNIKI
jgi:hypothetical protein